MKLNEVIKELRQVAEDNCLKLNRWSDFKKALAILNIE